jgi:hypothetical protein
MMLFSLRGLLEASPVADRVLAAVAGDLRCAPDRHRPAADGRLQQAFRWASPGHRARSRTVGAGRGGADRVPCRLRIFAGSAGSVRAGMGSFSGGACWSLAPPPWCSTAQRACASCHPDGSVVPQCAQRRCRAVARATRGNRGPCHHQCGGRLRSAAWASSLPCSWRSKSLMGATLEVGTVSIAFESVATALAVALATVGSGRTRRIPARARNSCRGCICGPARATPS